MKTAPDIDSYLSQIGEHYSPLPEANLWLYVLLLALQDLASTEQTPKARYWRRQAEFWVSSGSDEVGSMIWICQHVGLDQEYLQSFIERHRDAIPGNRERVGAVHTILMK